MQVKIFCISDSLEKVMNQWLSELSGHVEDMRIGESFIIVMYSDEPRQEEPIKGPAICRQCRKRLATKGKKSCEACLKYQKEYREEKKAEKASERYLP